MFKILSATALSATIVLATLAPTPALAADEDDVARFLLGAGFLALLATAINESNDRSDNKRKHVTNKTVTKVIKTPGQPHKPRTIDVKRPVRGKPHSVEVKRALPGSCARTFRTENGNRSFFTRGCLQEKGIKTANLPNQCERILDMPGNRENRRVWNKSCLTSRGYAIR